MNGFRTSQAWYQKASIGAHQAAQMMTHMPRFARFMIARCVD